MKWIGENLKNTVKESGMTQQQLADKMGVSRATVISWMKDQVPKGIDLMMICRSLRVSPNIFFENDICFSAPRYRLVAHAKNTEQLSQEAHSVIEEFSSFFSEDHSEPLQLTINLHKQSNPQVVANELRKMIQLPENSAIKLKSVFDLAKTLGVFVIPIKFPDALSHKISAFYTLFNSCNKVIFVNIDVNCLDLVYFILHEICHAITGGAVPDFSEDDEEKFCEATAQAMQFPECYVAKVYTAINGKSTGIVINTLKKLSSENHHSLYGIAKAIDRAYGKDIASRVGGANQNLNKVLPKLKDLILADGSIHEYIHNFSIVAQRYFEKIILKEYSSISDRKLCEMLGLDDVVNVDELRAELERCANASQAGCAY